MGVLMESYEKEADALRYFKTAIETGERENDICTEAYHNAANLCLRHNLYDTAEMWLNRGYVLTSDSSFLYESIIAARRAGMFDDAEQFLEEYANKEKIERSSLKYAIELAHIYREKGLDRHALDIYESFSDESCDAALEAGKILMYRGKFKKALKFMKKAVELYKAENPKGENLFFLSEFYLWAARAAKEGGFKEEAKDLAIAGFDLIPDDYEKYESCLPMLEQMLGGLYTIIGNYIQAEIHLKRALESRKCDYCIHGYCIDACYEMIHLCLLTGRREEAFGYLQKGIAADPVDTDFRNIKEQIEKGKR